MSTVCTVTSEAKRRFHQASEVISHISSELQTYANQVANFCDLIPPVDSLQSFLANLPIIISYLATIPIRYFLCLLLTILDFLNPCFIYNLFPIISIIEPYLSAVSHPPCIMFGCTCCYNSCNLNIPNIFADCPASVFNFVFCLLGAIMGYTMLPIIDIVNLIASLVGSHFCIPIPNLQNCLNLVA